MYVGSNAVVELESKCGFRYGFGSVLILGKERWGVSTLHQSRFWYISDQKVTESGDMRAFVLTSVRKPATLPPTWVQASRVHGGQWIRCPAVVRVCMLRHREDGHFADGVSGGVMLLIITCIGIAAAELVKRKSQTEGSNGSTAASADPADAGVPACMIAFGFQTPTYEDAQAN